MDKESREMVEAVNRAFYVALESCLIEQMDEVWAHEEWVGCVHPGWDMISGWRRVRDSWKRIFESGQKMKISASDLSVTVAGQFAWVTCTENITVFDDSSFDSAQAVATNLFIYDGRRWLMAHHHASPVPVVIPDAASDIIQ
jgi:ketosteroid isomerase-like protein